VEQEELAVASQRCGKHVSAATNKHATTEDVVFSMQSVPKLYDDQQKIPSMYD
jgi:hypothetical protein